MNQTLAVVAILSSFIAAGSLTRLHAATAVLPAATAPHSPAR
jgi:hypothetical protein